MRANYNLPCNIAQTLNIVGDRWTLLILHEILMGASTFNEIKKGLEGISSNLLSDRLKYLTDSGLITHSLYSDHPPRYQYTLTESGRDLAPVFNALLTWGRKHLEKCYKKLVHDTCRHEVEMAYYCSHCQENVREDELLVLPFDEKEGVSS
ncbi:DNA-binding transcriptional regulator, HxlR family [Lentibacillus persicus]|uniref:DNA-binding transcriptional regulator, HxlR family n=1 Tax=Lentibacillus persicus TaxID=640948 RepID=A0A1I1XD09_9BACI|nr:helix-turn-helix domain-containing protein [Lentibacillus persicus]SFE05294.1 DNA-binding transcriptional regulator, HxlR family [Lentibacillus persicus]